MAHDNSATTNTILIVLLLVVVVAGLIWFFRGGVPANTEPDFNVDVSLPEGGGAGSGSPVGGN